MNITILGAGAIGSLWAYHLSRAGHKVLLWSRDKKQSHISIALDKQEPIHFPANCAKTLTESDLLLVTLKAWQIESALEPLLESLSTETVITFMHNGMGVIESLYSKIAKHPIVLATTTQGAYRPSSNRVKHTGEGTTMLGGYNDSGKQCAFLADVLHHALPNTIWSDDIVTELWKKLAINCAINPLTAVHQCRNGELLSDQFDAELGKLVGEICAVLNAQGMVTCFEAQINAVRHVAQATAQNYSSMHQDIAHHRPTEIEFITGYLCKVAARHQIPTPTNLALYNKIKQLEQSGRET